MKLRLVAAVMTLFFACCLIALPAGARTAQASHPASALEYDQNPPSEQGVEVEIDGERVMVPDLMLRDQEGRKIRFYSDLIKGKVVVLSFFYTSCTYICTIRNMHSAITFIVNDKRGVWIGTEGAYKPEDLLKEVDDIARDSADRSKQ